VTGNRSQQETLLGGHRQHLTPPGATSAHLRPDKGASTDKGGSRGIQIMSRASIKILSRHKATMGYHHG